MITELPRDSSAFVCYHRIGGEGHRHRNQRLSSRTKGSQNEPWLTGEMGGFPMLGRNWLRCVILKPPESNILYAHKLGPGGKGRLANLCPFLFWFAQALPVVENILLKGWFRNVAICKPCSPSETVALYIKRLLNFCNSCSLAKIRIWSDGKAKSKWLSCVDLGFWWSPLFFLYSILFLYDCLIVYKKTRAGWTAWGITLISTGHT